MTLTTPVKDNFPLTFQPPKRGQPLYKGGPKVSYIRRFHCICNRILQEELKRATVLKIPPRIFDDSHAHKTQFLQCRWLYCPKSVWGAGGVHSLVIPQRMQPRANYSLSAFAQLQIRVRAVYSSNNSLIWLDSEDRPESPMKSPMDCCLATPRSCCYRRMHLYLHKVKGCLYA